MPLSTPVAVTAVLLAAVVGGAIGVMTRRWLAWLGRGARVPVSWCVAGTGVSCAGVAALWVCGTLPGPVVPLLLGLGWLTVAGSAVDVAVRRLPDALTLPALPAMLGLLVPLGGPAVARGAVAALVLGGIHALVHLCVPAAMGGGDVKLAAVVGAALGGVSWEAVVLGTVLAAAFTATAVPVLRTRAAPGARRRGGGGTGAGPVGRALPHGPSMLVSCLAVVVAAAAASPGPAGVG